LRRIEKRHGTRFWYRAGRLIAAKIICCGGLVLAATGAFPTVGAWLTAGGCVWTGAVAGALLVGLALLYRRADVRVGAKAAALGYPTRQVP
jgi:hypothetical protein